MGTLGDRKQFCEKNMGSLGEIVKNTGSFSEGDAKNGVLTALHTNHLRNGSAPTPGEF